MRTPSEPFFHAHRGGGGRHHEETRPPRRQIKSDPKQQRRQEGQPTNAEPRDEAADPETRKVRTLKKRRLQDEIRRFQRVPPIGAEQNHAEQKRDGFRFNVNLMLAEDLQQP